MPDINEPPEWVVPSLDRLEVEELRRDLPRAYSNRMPLHKQQWWQDYMNNLDNLTQVFTMLNRTFQNASKFVFQTI